MMPEKELIVVVGPTLTMLRLFFISLADDLTDLITSGSLARLSIDTKTEEYRGYVLYDEWSTSNLHGIVPKRVIIVNCSLIPEPLLSEVWRLEQQYSAEVHLVTV